MSYSYSLTIFKLQHWFYAMKVACPTLQIFVSPFLFYEDML